MSLIENFPRRLLYEHARMHWNMLTEQSEMSGVDFIMFHRAFIRKALRWYQAQGYDPKLVESWNSIPSEVKRHPWWSSRLYAAENRVVNHLDSFNSLEEFGRYLQDTRLHGAVHILGARMLNEPDFAGIASSPKSTYFYQWHGLIDDWARQLESRL